MARLSGVNKKMSGEHEFINQLFWGLHIAEKWGIKKECISEILRKKSSYLRDLYPLCTSIIQGAVSEDDEVIFDCTSHSAEFMGRIGESNRSIQGKACFPVLKPAHPCRDLMDQMVFFTSLFIDHEHLEYLREMKMFQSPLSDTHHSVPFAIQRPGGELGFYIKPRMISYYEVEITPSSRLNFSDMNTNMNGGDVGNQTIPTHNTATTLNNTTLNNTTSSNTTSNNAAPAPSTAAIATAPVELPHNGVYSFEGSFECVAVGLATKPFLKHKRLPGWDSESYGYHGDDGAIFHGRGRQLSTFGPKFGFHDVIGCGLNHQDRSIFFTLNGRLLGTAFASVAADVELYPTVGIDANCSIQFNFGMKPFKFDLLDMLEQQALLI